MKIKQLTILIYFLFFMNKTLTSNITEEFTVDYQENQTTDFISLFNLSNVSSITEEYSTTKSIDLPTIEINKQVEDIDIFCSNKVVDFEINCTIIAIENKNKSQVIAYIQSDSVDSYNLGKKLL